MVELSFWGMCTAGLLLLQSANIEMVPPSSPFSWEASTAPTDEKAQLLSTNGRLITGNPQEPSSVSFVTFHDERPYGEMQDRAAWLAEYRDVSVPAPHGGAPARISLFLVVPPTDGLTAAFTPAAAVWAKSPWRSEVIAGRATEEWDFFPLDTAVPLQSTIVDVLHEFWEYSGVNPMNVGQITIRPRQFVRKSTIYDENGDPMPKTKKNWWLVESLGRHAGMTSFGAPMTIRQIVFRDGDLEFCGGVRQ